MAQKFKVPVFPHEGGVGLCEYVQHLCMIDYVLINGEKDNKLVEYQDSLHEHLYILVLLRMTIICPH